MIGSPQPASATKPPKYISGLVALGYFIALAVVSIFLGWKLATPRHFPEVSLISALAALILYALTNGVARKAYLTAVVKRRSPELYARVIEAQAAERSAREAEVHAEAEARRVAFENSPGEIAKREAAAYEERLRSGALQPLGVQGLVVASGEKVYWSESASVVVHTIRTEYVGGYSGASVRVMRGVSLRTGSFRGHPVKQDVRVHEDSGTLNITDRRIVFVGSTESKEIAFAKISSVRVFSDGIEVLPANKKAIGFETGNPHAGIVLERLINHDVSSHVKASAPLTSISNPKSESTVKTSRTVMRAVAAQIRDHIAVLRSDFNTLDPNLPPASPSVSLLQYTQWIGTKFSALRDLFSRAERLIGAGLQAPLAAPDEQQARIATARWLHECDDVCYEMIAWEKDVRATPVPPLLAEAHHLMYGQTLEAFEQIEALPKKIEDVASGDSDAAAQLSVSSTISGARLEALSKAVQAATPQ